MGQSYRIRTELGITKTINVQLDQEFEQLEILSLKLQQEDVYTRSCADYGVLVGRITANNGFGLPNARVSIFIPITNIDESNPIISSIYPYKSPTDKNEDGYRYNLLPYEKSYSVHAATGTLPSRLDALTGSTAVEIFDKYYKFTAKTNDSGDYMIMGVPLGYQTVVMDVDLSDIGEFSLTPQDLIRIGLANESQVAGNRFRTSNDINSLPQIINLVKNLEISPLWGDPGVCDIAINRLDFDLRDEANVNIQPTSVFMGSIYSTSDEFRVKRTARPRDNMGNLCSLQAGPGQVLSIRQTIQQGSDGNPILEQYELEQAGNIIDGDGTWLTELPMNLDYYITNEFGEKVISNDPTIGIPTKGKYRFKIKWTQPTALTEQTRRPYFLVPNVREYGWSNPGNDPIYSNNILTKKRLAGSYYFGLDWTGYTNVNAAVVCDDTFYQFDYNKVYTVSGFIDEFKNGGRARFIGIKEIDSNDCDNTINKFPVNEGFRNFDLIYFLFAILFTIIQYIGIPLLVAYHIAAWLSELFKSTALKIALWPLWLLTLPIRKAVEKAGTIKLPMITYPECQACDCGETVNNTTSNAATATPIETGVLTQVSSSSLYLDKLSQQFNANLSTTISQAMSTNDLEPNNPLLFKTAKSSPVGFFNYSIQKQTLPIGERINVFNTRNKYFEGVNKIKVTFASDVNLTYHYDNTLTVLATEKIASGTLLSFVSPDKSTDKNYLWSGATSSGAVLNGINGTIKTNGFNINVEYADPSNTNNNLTTLYTIPAQTVNCVDSVTVDVTSLGTITYADCAGDNNTYNAITLGVQTITDDNCITLNTFGGTAIFNLINSGDTCQRYDYPSDIEYYQVLTAITITTTTINGVTIPVVPNSAGSGGFYEGVLRQNSIIENYEKQTVLYPTGAATLESTVSLNPTDYMLGFTDQVILVLQRGVDPYSPLLTNKYSIGTIFGTNDSDPNWTFTASTRINVPIQKIPNGSPTSIPQHNNQNNIYFQSHFYTPGVVGSTTPGLQYSSYTTSNVGYYGALDGISTGRAVIIPGASYPSSNYVNQTPLYGSSKGVSTKTANVYYESVVSVNDYDVAEDLSGGAILWGNPLTVYPANTTTLPYTQESYGPFATVYFSPILYPSLTGTSQLSITGYSKNIMRTDRLPSSDYIDSGNLRGNASLLQQNLGFAVYVYDGNNITYITPGYSTGASQASPNIGGQLASLNVIETLGNCQKLVGLDCYQGDGVSFGVKPNCSSKDTIVNGCYVLVQKPLTDLQKDINSFSEWGYRFRFFYGLCRGVLSQTFTNNWVNGSLYMFPIQVDTYFDTQNQPLPPEFAKELVYFDSETNNFYFRSSPYYADRFIGRPTTGLIRPTNERNLLFPTTIVNLGMKDSFYGEINYEPSSKGYIMNNLNPTSYSDTSDLVNLFVISRITNSSFLFGIPTNKDSSLDMLFTRDGDNKRIDGDLAQLMSINSEFGVIPFSPEFYTVNGSSTDPVVILGPPTSPTMGVFFSSTTFDLQNKDFLTPGVIDFRPSNNANAITYPYGIKSQYVPFYQWELKQKEVQNIFGSQYNNWKTNESPNINNTGIFGFNYQSLDRRNIDPPTYFVGSNNTSDLYQRGYIFNVNSNGKYSYSIAGVPSNKFLVSAPFHFYFGIVKGNSALDKFKTKYSVVE